MPELICQTPVEAFLNPSDNDTRMCLSLNKERWLLANKGRQLSNMRWVSALPHCALILTKSSVSCWLRCLVFFMASQVKYLFPTLDGFQLCPTVALILTSHLPVAGPDWEKSCF
jgi:hypothetical protein